MVDGKAAAGVGLSKARYKIGLREPIDSAKTVFFAWQCRINRTLVRELDSSEINEVMRRMFVRATKTSLAKSADRSCMWKADKRTMTGGPKNGDLPNQ